MTDSPFRFLLLGDTGVGKTSCLLRFVNNEFSSDANEELGAGIESLQKTIKVDGVDRKLKILDTAGRERFRQVTGSYYNGAQVVLCMYDVCDKTTLSNCRGWLDEVSRYAQDPKPLLVLVGNKIDATEKRVLSTADGKELADACHATHYEVSAKTAENLEGMFIEMTKKFIASSSSKQDDEVDLATKMKDQEMRQQKKTKSRCCSLQ